jgi:hypothetical protein
METKMEAKMEMALNKMGASFACKIVPNTVKADAEHIYFIRRVEGGDHAMTKLGRTNNPTSRLMTLQIGNEFELGFKYILETTDCKMLETELKRFFAEKRKLGEWFAISENEVHLIVKALTQHCPTVQIESEMKASKKMYPAKMIRVTSDKYISVYDAAEQIGSRSNAIRWWKQLKHQFKDVRIAHFKRRRQSTHPKTDKIIVMNAQNVLKFLKDSAIPHSERENSLAIFSKSCMGEALRSESWETCDQFDKQNVASIQTEDSVKAD